jgi:cytochrome c oxidase subunit 2
VGTLAIALLAGCTISPATQEAQRVQGLYNLFLVSAAGVFVVVAGLIGWNILRYRARPDDAGLPTQTQSNIALEITWWALPTLLVIVLFAVSAVVLNTNDAQTPGPALRVKVEGFQWQWRFTYTDANVVVTGTRDQQPELMLPVGEVVDFQLVSDDVIHSFYIPHFLVKRDLIPGVDNHLQLTIDEAGTYSGQCAEFCGLYHDEMRFTIRAVPQAEFATWLAAQPGNAP